MRPERRSLKFASGRQVSKRTLFVVLQCGGWLSFGILLFMESLSIWGALGALLNSGTFILTGGLVTYLLRKSFIQARSAGLSFVIVTPLVVVSCGVLAEAWYAIDLFAARRVFTAFAPLMSSYPKFQFGMAQLAQPSYLISATRWYVYSFTLLLWSSLYFGVNSMIDLEFERAHAAEATQLADAARMRMLQAQLNPHFLFNALNGVASLIRTEDYSRASKMVLALSGFLRSTLHRTDVAQISLSEELILVDQYVELQQLRFGDRLRIDVDAHDDTFAALVPTLILQPLIENAVQHGALTQERCGHVVISVRRVGAELRALVEDNGPGPGVDPPQFGVGLTNVEERLNTLYGSRASMSVGRAAGGGFAVLLTLPFQEAKDRMA
jgi:two-component system LytT family sensor kinase